MGDTTDDEAFRGRTGMGEHPDIEAVRRAAEASGGRPRYGERTAPLEPSDGEAAPSPEDRPSGHDSGPQALDRSLWSHQRLQGHPETYTAAWWLAAGHDARGVPTPAGHPSRIPGGLHDLTVLAERQLAVLEAIRQEVNDVNWRLDGSP